MSRRIHFRPIDKTINIENIKEQIELLTGFMMYDKEINEVTTFTKSTNESFYEIGCSCLYDETRSIINNKEELIYEFSDGSKLYAKIETPEEIQKYLTKNKDIINNILENDSDYFKLDYAKHLIKMYQFAVNNNLEIWIH